MDKIMANKKPVPLPIELLKTASQFIENNQFELAINILKEGQLSYPNEFSFVNLLAQISLRKKNTQDGINFLKQSLKINSNQPIVMLDLGIALSIINQLDEAIIFFDKSIELEPKNLKVFIRKVITLKALGRLHEAIDCNQRIIELDPNYIEAYIHQADLLDSIGMTEKSLSVYQKGVKIDPDNARLYIKYGNLLNKLGRFDEALNNFKKSIGVTSENEGALNNIGYLLIKLRKFDEAILYLKKSISLRENYEVYNNLGGAYCSLGKILEGISYFDKAIKSKADLPESHILKAHALQLLGKPDQAILSYNHTLINDKDFKYAFGERFHSKNTICDWSNYEDDISSLGLKLQERKKVAVPLAVCALFEDPAIQKIGAEIYANDFYPLNNSLGPIDKHPKNKKIRIGYFSGDFREHPVGYLVTELFEMHDKSKFELYAFSISNRIESKTRSRIEKSFDEFIDAANYSDQKVASISRARKIDIAIDLGGYTKNSRPSILAMRAAPIQINFLGYPGTMGTDYIDYTISDKNIIPKEFQQHYSEKIIYLPKCYQPCEGKIKPSKKLFSRKSEGLPDSAFVFCCFNNNWKITPKIFKLWVNLLFSIKDSILWFPGTSSLAITNLKKECIALGMDENRLVFSSIEQFREDHHAKIRLADIFLDCFPYGAQSTASDFLRSGIPVITLRGSSFSNQVASSLLINLNLPELITSSELDYTNLAIKFAENPKYLKEIKMKLIANVNTSSIYNIKEYVSSIESGYIQVYNRYHDDLFPDHVEAM